MMHYTNTSNDYRRCITQHQCVQIGRRPDWNDVKPPSLRHLGYRSSLNPRYNSTNATHPGVIPTRRPHRISIENPYGARACR